MTDKIKQGQPHIAIIDSNTLAVLGLKQILQNVMPFAIIDTFGSFPEFETNDTTAYFHYFVETSIVLSNRNFFTNFRHKTIVLTTSINPSTQLNDFHCICINVPEKQLIHSLLKLEQSAHAHGRNLPPIHKGSTTKTLSDREIEVLTLIVEGYINKEIADKLNIGMTTVITHRKKIMEKLNIKSVAALTIYAVMQGYVDINRI